MGRGMRKYPDDADGRSSTLAGSVLVLLGILLFVPAGEGKNPVAAKPCQPTRADSEGPFYKPGAPLRTSTGSGLVVGGGGLGVPHRPAVPAAPSVICAGGGRRSSSTLSSSRKGEDPRRYPSLSASRILGYESHSMVPPEEIFLIPRGAEGEG